MERVSDAFVAIDKDWCYTYLNKKAEKIMGRKPGKLIGKHIWTEFPEGIDQPFYKAYYRAMKEQQYIHLEEYYSPFGVWLENHIYPSPEGLSIFFRDITDRKQAEQQKEFDSNNLSALINNTNDLMWSVDKDLKLITFNDSFNRAIEFMSGKPLIKGSHILSTQFTENQMKRYKIFYERALSGETFTLIDHFDSPVEVWSEISFYPIHQGDAVIGTACFSRDITERKKAEEALKSMEEEILNQKVQEQKKIARAMIIGQEKEKDHLARELHDNINQLLAGVKLYLSTGGNKSAQVKKIIKYPIELIDKSIEEIRSLCRKMVTPVKNIDLSELVQGLLYDLTQNSTIKSAFTCSISNETLSDELKLNIYRIIQEQTNNILKHAEAKNVNISLKEQDKVISIIISDDGKGFNVKSKRKGIGISNMTNRIESYNGKVEIKSRKGNGCKIQITIPV